MKREQAENILDVYVAMEVDLHFNETFSREMVDAIREVVLDAMTEEPMANTRWQGYGITLPATSYPTKWGGSLKVTCTGIDPAFTGVTANGN